MDLCSGCDRRLPLVAKRDLINGTTRELSRGWMPCRRMDGWWHGPTPAEVDRVVGRNPVPGTAPEDGPPRRRGKAGTGPLEEEIRMACRRALNALGYLVYDFEQGYRPDSCRSCGERIPGGTRVPKGVGDAFCVGNGRAFWLEFKRPGERRTPEQVEFAADIQKLGDIPCYLVTGPGEIGRLHHLVGELGRLPTDQELHHALETAP